MYNIILYYSREIFFYIESESYLNNIIHVSELIILFYKVYYILFVRLQNINLSVIKLNTMNTEYLI